MADQYLKEAIEEYLDDYAEKRLSILRHKSQEMEDFAVREELAKWKTALELKAGLVNRLGL